MDFATGTLRAGDSDAGRGTDAVLLIVDDEPDILSALGNLLTDEIPGLRVLTADSGLAGLAIASENHVDMILTDFHMPSMDGVEFLRRARMIQSQVQTAIMSAGRGSAIPKFGPLPENARQFIPKPFDIPNLVAMVRHNLAPAPAAA